MCDHALVFFWVVFGKVVLGLRAHVVCTTFVNSVSNAGLVRDGNIVALPWHPPWQLLLAKPSLADLKDEGTNQFRACAIRLCDAQTDAPVL